MNTDQKKEDEVLRRMLATKPKPHKPARPTLEFVILDGRLLPADIRERNGSSMVADLYRNLDDKEAGQAMERHVRLERQSSAR